MLTKEQPSVLTCYLSKEGSGFFLQLGGGRNGKSDPKWPLQEPDLLPSLPPCPARGWASRGAGRRQCPCAASGPASTLHRVSPQPLWGDAHPAPCPPGEPLLKTQNSDQCRCRHLQHPSQIQATGICLSHPNPWLATLAYVVTPLPEQLSTRPAG